MVAVTICSDLGAKKKKIKSVTLSIVSPPISHEVMGLDAMHEVVGPDVMCME